jgi:multicomponent Na+:H+ antiporter subunit D
MGIAAAACVIIGVLPSLLYAHLPFPVEYHPYTPRHVTDTLGLLGFTALGFFLLLKMLDPHPNISVDTDWFYRRGTAAVLPRLTGALAAVETVVGGAYEVVMRQLVFHVGRLLRVVDSSVVDAGMVGIGHLTEKSSGELRKTVTGNPQYYGLVMAAGVLVIMALAVFGP